MVLAGTGHCFSDHEMLMIRFPGLALCRKNHSPQRETTNRQ